MTDVADSLIFLSFAKQGEEHAAHWPLKRSKVQVVMVPFTSAVTSIQGLELNVMAAGQHMAAV